MDDTTLPLNIEWIEADHCHCADLNKFTCTRPKANGAGGWRLPDKKNYERDVQAGIRNARPPVRQGQLQLGYLSGTLGAVSWFEFDEEKPETFIKAVAIGEDHRDSDGWVADEAMERVLRQTGLHYDALGYTNALIIGKIDENNGASQRLARRKGFTPTGLYEDSLQFWDLRLEW